MTGWKATFSDNKLDCDHLQAVKVILVNCWELIQSKYWGIMGGSVTVPLKRSNVVKIDAEPWAGGFGRLMCTE